MDPADLQAQYEAAQTHEPVPEVISFSSFVSRFPVSPVKQRLLTLEIFTPQGPLVGKKTLSTAITDEYAKADPVYVEKTLVRRASISEVNLDWARR